MLSSTLFEVDTPRPRHRREREQGDGAAPQPLRVGTKRVAVNASNIVVRPRPVQLGQVAGSNGCARRNAIAPRR